MGHVQQEIYIMKSAVVRDPLRGFSQICRMQNLNTNTLSYRIAVADGISVVVNQFLKINKRGGSNKHGGKCMEICFYSLHTETIPRKLINVADQIRACRTDFFCKINRRGAMAIR